jgi:tRNA pseudouridine38-40 synthase
LNFVTITVFTIFTKKTLQRYFIQLSFKGTPFNGWQKQQNAPSVQVAIENALSLLIRKKIDVVGAGRTDTGVHANYYIAHFDSPIIIENLFDFVYHLNKILPYEISVQKIIPVTPDAHARFDAISRTYSYRITQVKDPFGKEFSYYLSYPFDINILNNVSQQLLNYNDFTSFCKLHSDNKTNLCHIYQANWQMTGNEFIFTIKADRFLRNMVRAIVGTIIDVGRGKISVQDFIKIIESKNRSTASTSAPAHGLYLKDIEYPERLFIHN